MIEYPTPVPPRPSSLRERVEHINADKVSIPTVGDHTFEQVLAANRAHDQVQYELEITRGELAAVEKERDAARAELGAVEARAIENAKDALRWQQAWQLAADQYARARAVIANLAIAWNDLVNFAPIDKP